MAKVFSNEDTNLSSSIRVVRERLYSDIDLSLDVRPDGDIYRKTDVAAVKQAIKNLILTNSNEKPYQPNYGANISGLLFELMSPDAGDRMIDRIKNSIQKYEPRARVLNLKVTATPDYNSVSVIIEFSVVNTGFVDSLRVGLTNVSNVIDTVLPTTPEPVYNDILMTETESRLLTYNDVLIRVDVGEVPNGAILTVPEEDWLLTQSGLPILIQQI